MKRAFSPRAAGASAILAIMATAVSANAATLALQQTNAETMALRVTRKPGFYFYLEQSIDLRHFTPFAMVMGDTDTTWDLYLDPENPARFFRSITLNVFSPGDTDGDGIDDVYEMRHPVLNPLDPTDAALDPDRDGLTYLDEYRGLLALGSAAREVYSREVSTFNFGAPLESAISREVSVFNFGSPLASVEAMSREVSVFNGEGGAPLANGIREVYSREVSTYNFGAPLAAIEAMSREVSVFNGEADATLTNDIREVYSREVSTFNHGAPTSPVEAISREVSVFNDVP